RELEEPLHRSRVGIESDERVRVEIVAEPVGAVHLRTGIARAPVERVELRIVGAGYPRRRAAPLPRIALPGLDALLAVSRNRRAPPRALAGFGVVSVEESADAVLAAGHPDDDLVLHRERRAREAEALVGVGGRDVPTDASRPRIESDDVSVERAHEDL